METGLALCCETCLERGLQAFSLCCGSAAPVRASDARCHPVTPFRIISLPFPHRRHPTPSLRREGPLDFPRNCFQSGARCGEHRVPWTPSSAASTPPPPGRAVPTWSLSPHNPGDSCGSAIQVPGLTVTSGCGFSVPGDNLSPPPDLTRPSLAGLLTFLLSSSIRL